MSNLGLGVMINELCDNGDTAKAITKAIGRTIEHISMDGEELHIDFEGGFGVKIWDDGQS